MRWTSLSLVFVAACWGATDDKSTSSTESLPSVRWIAPADAVPSGHAPNAKHRVIGTHPDGTREIVVVLSTGDDVMTALADLARTQNIRNARFTGIGALSEAEVGWFDPTRKQYKGLAYKEQLEMISLTGDITVGVDGKPSVHAHASLGRASGAAVGGHVLSAIAMPTLEIYLTAYNEPLTKKMAKETDTQVIDLGN